MIQNKADWFQKGSTPSADCRLNGKTVPHLKSKVLITGGGGYFGYNLGCALTKLGITVVLFDIQKPKWELPNGATHFQGDVRDYNAVFKACRGVDCVFHVASHGMSGLEQLQKKEVIESINVDGTKVVIDVCKERNIPRLIYTSTVNVVFGGNPIEDGDETLPYFPLEKQVNHYSRTKAMADQMILAANGTPLKGGEKLHTCVLRPPGIYGPGEQRHLPRVVKNIQRGLFNIHFGNPKSQMNWVHVKNLIQAHLLAAETLTPEKGYKASGQAYYINDGENVLFSEWITPLFEKLGYSKPWIHIPTFLIYTTAILLEFLHLALKPVFKFTPVLTRNEVRSITVTHTFRIEKACNQLGYCPKKFALADSVDHYLQTTPKYQNHYDFLKIWFVFGTCLCLIFLILLS
ncbi:putative short-chain dehydrogenase/reductase family 42E member 2 [Pelodiscus sinensis]|uniref:putative short-chain dehydrogenase/reductase family 42E member 2 n=1 Tax=Pelodiscus sinensis TaxID=13735 RepID=UPI00070401BE|nr:putative short-chain dehydrogenase/reductase family 42E member 2 [Pelodiscus sinensis]|eukprot:XP_014436809.1 putative short-chain dehydrogenase/reductase family 42E member 2 [Pelodiscus sinensis]